MEANTSSSEEDGNWSCEASNTSDSTIEAEWSYETRFEFVVHGLLISIIGLFGLLGNLASIVTLSRPQMRNSINTILIALVSCDCLLIVTSLLMFSFTVFHHTGWLVFKAYSDTIYPYVVPFVYPIAMTAQTASAYLTMAVTVERYLAVCWPLKARSICTIGRAKTAVGCVAGFAVIYNIPRFFEISWGQVQDQQTCANRTVYFPTELRMHENYISIYVTWMYLVFMYLIPFSTLAIFNFKTWLEMRRASARRAHLSTQELKEHNLATMLLVVVLVFFICNLLPLVVNIMELFVHTDEQVIQVSNLLVTINSSVNIIIYCTFGKKFRTVFMQIFLGKQPVPCINMTTNHRLHQQQQHRGSSAQSAINGTEIIPLNSFHTQQKTSPSVMRMNQHNHRYHKTKVRIERTMNDNEDDIIENGNDAIIYANDQKSVGVQAKII